MRFLIIINSILLLFFSFTASWAASSPKVFQEKGLVAGQPGINTFPGTSPGEATKLKPPYQGAPALIPHSTAGFIISRSRNECLDCHAEGLELREGHRATKVPPSHYHNEYSGQKNTDKLAGIRYNCHQCHVEQSSEEPPVSTKKPD